MQKSDGRLESEAVVAEKGDVLPDHLLGVTDNIRSQLLQALQNKVQATCVSMRSLSDSCYRIHHRQTLVMELNRV